MEIQVLASSSSGNAYVVSDGVTPLLIECGIRYRDIQQGLGFSVAELGGCLVTHAHQDHCRSVKQIMRAGINVYASLGTWSDLGFSGLSHRTLVVRAGTPITIGTWRVMPFDTIHDANEPLGFYLVSSAGRVLYMTDSAYCRQRFAGLTHLLIEANYSEEILQRRVNAGDLAAAHCNRVLRNHLSLERLLEMLEANDLSQVQEIWLLHLSDGNSDERAFQERVAAATGKPVFVAQKNRLAGEAA